MRNNGFAGGLIIGLLVATFGNGGMLSAALILAIFVFVPAIVLGLLWQIHPWFVAGSTLALALVVAPLSANMVRHTPLAALFYAALISVWAALGLGVFARWNWSPPIYHTVHRQSVRQPHPVRTAPPLFYVF
jgi:hypothetical protein